MRDQNLDPETERPASSSSERIEELRSRVADGTYNVTAEQLAESLFRRFGRDGKLVD